ncbi:MAG: DNA primase [Bacteroidales bacterium]
MIDQITIDKIFEAARIEEVVEDYVHLKRAGASFKACCPFHSERTPSFVVTPSKNLFKCFGCGKGGNPVTFVMEHEHLGYVDALKLLGKKYGIDVQERKLSEEEKNVKDERESMMIAAAYAQSHFTKNLYETEEGKSIGLSYFIEREFKDSIIKKFQLGYSLNSRNTLIKSAIIDGYKSDFFIKIGLANTRENNEPVDRFYERAMFPIHNVSGRVIGFGGRTLKTEKNIAKYINSPESEIYHKSNTLYGIFFAKKAITQNDKCFLVEGYTDVISMHQAGIENVVASSGTSLTTQQIQLIKRFTQNVTVLYDGDAAGIKASLRGIDMLLEEGISVKTLLLPQGEDPDSFARTHSASELESFIAKNEKDFISFKAQLLLSDSGNDPIKKSSIINDIVRSISLIPDGITRSVYIKECSKLMEIGEDILMQETNKLVNKKIYALRAEIHKLKKHDIESEKNDTLEKSFQKQAIPAFVENIFCKEQEREIIYFLLKHGNENVNDTTVAKWIISEMVNEDLQLQNLEYRQIFEEYSSLLKISSEIDVKYFINHPNNKICSLSIDLLSEKYTQSKIWQNDINSNINVDIDKAIHTYKAKVITQAIQKIAENITEKSNEEQELDIEHLKQLNELRKTLAKKLQRPVL